MSNYSCKVEVESKVLLAFYPTWLVKKGLQIAKGWQGDLRLANKALYAGSGLKAKY